MRELLFYIYFGLMLWIKGIGLTGGSFYNAALVTGAVLVLITTFLGETTYRELCFDAVILILMGILPWRIAGNQGLIWCALLILAVRGMRYEKLCAFAARIWGLAFIFQMITQLTWFADRDFVIHKKFGMGYVIRWALGYSHPNVLQISYCVLVMYIFLAHRPSGRKMVAADILAIIGGGWVFLYSLSSTGVIFLAAFLFFYNGYEIMNRRVANSEDDEADWPFVIKLLTWSVLPLALFISLILPLILDGEAFDFLNRLFSTRYAMTRRYLAETGFSPFGVNVSFGATAMLDCSWANLFVLGGAVPFALMCGGYVFLICRLIKKHEGAALSVTLACIIAGMTEPFMFNTSFKNVSLVFMGIELSEAIKELELRTPVSRLSQRICLVPAASARLPVLTSAIFNEKNVKSFIAGAFIAACVIGTVGNIAVRAPDMIYALRSDCDVDDDVPSLYLTPVEAELVEADPDAWLLSYRDETTPMHRFSGDTTAFEKKRAVISSCLLTGSALYAVLAGLPFGFLGFKGVTGGRKK